MMNLLKAMDFCRRNDAQVMFEQSGIAGWKDDRLVWHSSPKGCSLAQSTTVPAHKRFMGGWKAIVPDPLPCACGSDGSVVLKPQCQFGMEALHADYAYVKCDEGERRESPTQCWMGPMKGASTSDEARWLAVRAWNDLMQHGGNPDD